MYRITPAPLPDPKLYAFGLMTKTFTSLWQQ
jgi:hypothetical protein